MHFFSVRRFFLQVQTKLCPSSIIIKRLHGRFQPETIQINNENALRNAQWLAKFNHLLSAITYRRTHREFNFLFSNHIFEFYHSRYSQANFCPFKTTIMSTYIQVLDNTHKSLKCFLNLAKIISYLIRLPQNFPLQIS